ncbi:DUF3545 family protein [Aliidiomarina halalkaliphila]|uniref:DUF3545 family protein n=1 Tax=Aliidiomarina halalkaliphila TaxID=2593535 RepID=A0A552X5Q2_9GAMM|nr:DUF3545 family protein [Aliidiomarina halalkaliphila]TRW50332.1 DUF3545 family protein [Aliidiomarina halalkaliphila]
MNHTEELSNASEKSGKGRAKRKWREIEALKERKRLEKELMDIDYTYDLDVDDLEF